MLSRRLFLGTTAGAAGLFGFFGRLRFRPQRRGRLIGVLIQGDGASLRVDQGDDPSVFVHFASEEKARRMVIDTIAGNTRRYFLPGNNWLESHLYATATIVRDQKGQWHPVRAIVSTEERAFCRQGAMICYGFRDYGLRGFGRFVQSPQSQSVVPIFA